MVNWPWRRNRKPANADIDLDDTPSAYIDLAKYGPRVVITGRWAGPRLVLRNVQDKHIVFHNARIESTHAEDALCIDGPCRGCTFEGRGRWQMDGALTFWGVAFNVTIKGLRSKGAHTGIRATRNVAHGNVTIAHCYITDTSHEGVYIGPSKADEANALGKVIVEHCTFYNNGWDAIQVGNCLYARIGNNSIDRAGTKDAAGQDYGITINPGTVAFLHGNKITNTLKAVQVLDSRAFFHEKKP